MRYSDSMLTCLPAKTCRTWPRLRERWDVGERPQWSEVTVREWKTQSRFRGWTDHYHQVDPEARLRQCVSFLFLVPVPRLTSGAFRDGKTWAPVNLDRIQHWIDQGRLESSPDKPITARELLLSGCIHNAHDGVKLLGNVSRTLLCHHPANTSTLYRVRNI